MDGLFVWLIVFGVPAWAVSAPAAPIGWKALKRVADPRKRLLLRSTLLAVCLAPGIVPIYGRMLLVPAWVQALMGLSVLSARTLDSDSRYLATYCLGWATFEIAVVWAICYWHLKRRQAQGKD